MRTVGPSQQWRMRFEVVTVLLVGLLGTGLGQVRWDRQGQAGQGGGGQGGQGGAGEFNPGDEFPALEEFPALGQPSSNPGVACRNETTGVFGPCTGQNVSSSSFLCLK